VYDRKGLSDLAGYQLLSLNVLSFQDFLEILKVNSSLLHPKFNQLLNVVFDDQCLHLVKYENKSNFVAESGSKYAQSRYERRPYPTWITIQKVQPIQFEHYLATIFPGCDLKFLVRRPLRVLIAGCGTGKQVIERALLYKDANFTAIDISSTSLQYARTQAKRFRVNNIKFIQMDIEKITSLGVLFDVIECVGVVHHLENPRQALIKLRSCIADDGFMKLGMYSRKAREDVETVRNIIREIKCEDELSPLECREYLMNQVRNKIPKSVLNTKDFYSVSGYENLLFNNVEHLYSIKEVFELLKELSLDFIGFDSNFKPPKKTEKSSIVEDWIQMEEINPLLFAGMYQPWAKVKS